MHKRPPSSCINSDGKLKYTFKTLQQARKVAQTYTNKVNIYDCVAHRGFHIGRA